MTLANTLHKSQQSLDKLQLFSPFAFYYINQTQLLDKFLHRFDLSVILSDGDLAMLIQEATDQKSTQEEAMTALRILRKQLMVRWIWQDALGLISLTQLMGQFSVFADLVIIFAKDFVYRQLIARYGEPIQTGKTQKNDEFAIIAMGKLGAKELNLSSDIDLIFVHLGNGHTTGNKCIANQKFMTQLGQGIIKMIDHITQDGFVFRVDMRLRPWGDGSSLVIGLKALDNYFAHHGRTWERFAWLKARVVNQISPNFLSRLEQLRQSFVFRYYVDYSTFSALREMRLLISNQVAQRQDVNNIKLGVGGIRDIEFIAQSYALIYGGKYPTLMQKTACLDALDELQKVHLLDQDVVSNLKHAYVFLRRLEHAIQARHDEQTQRLPKDELDLLAKALGFETSLAFMDTLGKYREQVKAPFEKLVLKRDHVNERPPSIDHKTDLVALTQILDKNAQHILDEFWQSRLIVSLGDEAKHRLERAYPVVIHALVSYQGVVGESLIVRLVGLLEAIVKRSIYLVMLSENPKATMDLIPMLDKGAWVADELKNYPVLLDTFLQKQYRQADQKTLQTILNQSLLSVVPFDDEAFLMAIRLFKKTQVLTVATLDVLCQYPIMKVSDSLTDIAQVVLKACLHRAYDELACRHGHPLDSDGVRLNGEQIGFALIGYGKLGGIEMGYGSDLDLVFLHRVDEQSQTDGQKPISGMKFATRLIQKIIGYLTTQTRDGRAYELDMRLRPSGNAGVMVNSLTGFESYQHHKAWVWEHQALVRARGICGDKKVLASFDKIRFEVLTYQRDLSKLKEEVVQMRHKMLLQACFDNSQFHLKKSQGGMIDIEFMAQFCVLAYAHQYPALATWSDTVRIFETAQNVGVWQPQRCQLLHDAYINLRHEAHKQTLAQRRAIVCADDWQTVRQAVMNEWACVFGHTVFE